MFVYTRVRLIFLFLFIFLASSCATRTIVDDLTLDAGFNAGVPMLVKAVLKSCNELNWVCSETAYGKLDAEYKEKDFLLHTEIICSSASCKIIYVKSNKLDFDSELRTIDVKYRFLVDDLKERIIYNIRRSGV